MSIHSVPAARRRGHRFTRWLFVGTGPLKRGSDRVEMAFRLLLLACLVAAAPVGIWQASAVSDSEAKVAAQPDRNHQPVQAEVLAVPSSVEGLPPEATVEAPVAWTAPDGRRSLATVPVLAYKHAHDRIRLWTAADGRLTGPPAPAPSPSALWAGVLTGLTVPVVGWALLGVASLVLGARRSHQWQSEWGAVEPVWSSRRSDSDQ